MPMNSTERKRQPKNEFERFFRHVRYKDWFFLVKPVGKTHFCLQVQFVAPDAVTGAVSTQYGRKWLLSEHMTDTELVVTAYKAVLAAEEHEVKERFTYYDTSVFNTHMAVNDVARLFVDGEIGVDIRSPPEDSPMTPKKKTKRRKK